MAKILLWLKVRNLVIKNKQSPCSGSANLKLVNPAHKEHKERQQGLSDYNKTQTHNHLVHK